MVHEDLIAIAEKEKAARKEIRVRCCMAAGCLSSRSAEVKTALEKAVNGNGLSELVEVCRVGCMGLCGQGPLVGVDPEGTLYEHVTPENAPSIIMALTGGKSAAARGALEHPFFARQVQVVLARSRRVDPERIEEYIASGGYTALHHDGSPGSWKCERLVAGTTAGISLANYFTPASLLTCAQAIFQASPFALVISVAGASFAYREQLTPSVEKVLPQVIDHVGEQIARLHSKPEQTYA